MKNKIVDLSTFCAVQFFARASVASGGERRRGADDSLRSSQSLSQKGSLRCDAAAEHTEVNACGASLLADIVAKNKKMSFDIFLLHLVLSG
jgi:hypothetical protein